MEGDGETALTELLHQVVGAGCGAGWFGAWERGLIGVMVTQDMIGAHEDGMADGDGRALFAASSGAGTETRPHVGSLLRPTAWAATTRHVRRQRLPRRVLLPGRLPALM